MKHSARLQIPAFGNYFALVSWVVLFLMAATRLLSADVTFSRGAYIIDMGQVPQTAANGLKPYGLIYQLVVNNQASVS